MIYFVYLLKIKIYKIYYKRHLNKYVYSINHGILMFNTLKMLSNIVLILFNNPMMNLQIVLKKFIKIL